MLHQLSQYNRSRFNNLPPIFAADVAMRKGDKLSIALSVLGPVFIKHKMSDIWGICVLHQHYSLHEGELPIQEVREAGGIREFVTAPRTAIFQKEFQPSVFAVNTDSPSSLQALEFSTDKRADEANKVLSRNPEFVQDFCETVIANGLETTFGLIVARMPSPGFDLVEFTCEERESVLKERTPDETEGKRLIETTWLFVEGEASNTCAAKCVATCVTMPGLDHVPAHFAHQNPAEAEKIEKSDLVE